jgi:hypothetical protein
MNCQFYKCSNFYQRLLQTLMVLLFIVPFTYGQSPGGVSSGLKIWLKANDGFNPSIWYNRASGGQNYVQVNASKQPKLISPSKRFNFHAGADFGTTAAAAAAGYWMYVPTGGPYSADNMDNTMFLLLNKNADPAGYADYLGFLCASCGNGANSDAANNGVFTSNTNGAPSYYPYGVVPNTQTQMKAFSGFSAIQDVSYTVGSGGIKYGNNGNNYSVTTNVLNAFSRTNKGSILGSQGEASKAAFGEVIGYERELTAAEKHKVRSYMAIKYGITMPASVVDYQSSAGSSFWTHANHTGYNENIFGVVKDDNSVLDQKISTSMNAGTVLTIATNNNFTVSNDDPIRTSLANNQGLMVGDNGVDPSLYSTFASCIVGNTGSVRLDKVWQAQNTNTVGSLFYNVNLAGSGINDEVYMLISTSPTFATYRQVPGVVNADGTATFNAKVGNNEYFTFSGVRLPGICPKCYDATGVLNWRTSGWTNGANGPVSLGIAGTGITASVEFKDPQAVEYAPAVRPLKYGKTILLDRWDKQIPPNGAYTASFTMSKASMVSFQVHAVDRWAIDCKDIVEVKGYCGTTVITPKLGYTLAPNKSSYTISGNKATGNKLWSGYFAKTGMLNVYFDRAVDKVEVIWSTTKKTGTVKRFQRIGLSNIKFECPEALACSNEDQVMITKRTADGNTSFKTCENVRFEYKVKNLNCTDKVVNISDVLPAGMQWVANTYEGGSLATGTPNLYANTGTFSLASLTVPAGSEVRFYVSAKFTTSTGSSYGNRATMTVNGGTAGTINSNCGNTSWTSVAGTPPPVPDITYAVSKNCYTQNGLLTYTVTLNNTTASTITGAEYQSGLQDEFTYVSGTLSTTLGGTANAYAGLEQLEIKGMSVPPGISSFTFQVNAGLSDSTSVMNASISADPDGDCATESTKYSNDITMAPCTPCVAGTTAPAITPTTASNSCPATTVDLSSLARTGSTPSGATLVWSLRKLPNNANDTLSNLLVGSGKYYALFRDAAAGCFSTAADSVTVTITGCTGIPSLQVPPGQSGNTGDSKSGDAAAELNPSGGTAPYKYTNGSGSQLCVAPVGASPLPASSNLQITEATGAYTYTAPSTPGTYYFCIMVCDSALPTPNCNVAVYTITVTASCNAGSSAPVLIKN